MSEENFNFRLVLAALFVMFMVGVSAVWSYQMYVVYTKRCGCLVIGDNR